MSAEEKAVIWIDICWFIRDYFMPGQSDLQEAKPNVHQQEIVDSKGFKEIVAQGNSLRVLPTPPRVLVVKKRPEPGKKAMH